MRQEAYAIRITKDFKNSEMRELADLSALTFMDIASVAVERTIRGERCECAVW